MVALTYALGAGLWLAGSEVLLRMASNAVPALLMRFGSGVALVSVGSVLLYLLVARMATARERERKLTQALAEAHEHMLAGWSRALDLRDHETEGHSARVTALAVRLAVAMGLSGEEIEHIRRGAMLHDIGKIGVPDAILRKPGPLAEEEWAVMRRHPEFAYAMLAPIAELGPVLDIPYCHHERWDGSGYPRGLAGEHIPLAARIFAVVDVWDALCSDRPYRAAWPRERVLSYLRAHAGGLFDPEVVRAFTRLIESERRATATPCRRVA